MRTLVPAFLVACVLVGCGRSDVVIAPGAPIVERELELDDGDIVLVEVDAGENMALRKSFFAVQDGVTLDDLVDAIALGEPVTLVLDATEEPVLIVEVGAGPRAWIWR
jgi:hypothetical protein